MAIAATPTDKSKTPRHFAARPKARPKDQDEVTDPAAVYAHEMKPLLWNIISFH